MSVMQSTSDGQRRHLSGAVVERSSVRAWAVTWMLFAFMLINFADKAVLGLAAKPIMHDLGISDSQYGLVASGFFFLFSVSALAVGFLADKVPSKWLLLGMALVWAVTQVPMIGTVGFGVLFASRIVLGAAEGPAFPIANHAVHKWFSNAARNVPSALLVVGAPVGVVIAAPTLTSLIVHHGWHAAFAVLSVIGFVWVVVWLFVAQDGQVADEPDMQEATDTAPTASYWRIIRTGTWLSCVLAGFASYWTLAMLVAWLPPYLENALGYSATATGNIIAVTWGVGGLIQLAQGFVTTRLMRSGISSRMARGILGGVSVVLAGVAGLAFVAAGAGPLKIVLMVLAFSLGSVMFPISQTVCAEISPAKQRGGILGAYAAVYALGGVIAPYLTGHLVQKGSTSAAGYDTSFVISAVLLIVGGIAATLFIRPEHDIRHIARIARKA